MGGRAAGGGRIDGRAEGRGLKRADDTFHFSFFFVFCLSFVFFHVLSSLFFSFFRVLSFFRLYFHVLLYLCLVYSSLCSFRYFIVPCLLFTS